MTTREQLSFPLPHSAAMGRADFLVTGANRTALALLDAAWPNGKLLLVAPEAGGKTHIATFFGAETRAHLLDARDLPSEAPEAHCIVENADRLPDAAAEERLFHLHNNLRSAGRRLLLTARRTVRHWSLSLPDLRSRMEATTLARIDAPDDALLPGLILKHLSDRQIRPAPEVLTYLATHIERSYVAVRDTVARLDRLALTEGRPVTRALAARALERE
ncbi:MAG: chromosomal replication initiator DnaA [Shimia sp.]